MEASESVLVGKKVGQQHVDQYHAFINLAMILAVITSVEIVLIFLPFANSVIMTLLVVLSVFKFFCVILWFMHLIYDKVLLFLIFMSGLLIAVGTVVALLFLFTQQEVDFSTFN